MSSQTNELIEFLRDSREYTKFMAELGVETAEPKAEIDRPVERVESSVVFARVAIPAAEPQNMQSIRVPKLKVNAPPAPPSDSLFDDLASPQPAFAPTDETLADIWKDIGDCTRC